MKMSPCEPQMLAEMLPEGGTVLEIGCGTGELLAYLTETGKYRLWGIDFNKDAVRQAAETGVPVEEGRAEALPYEGEKFDSVIMECVFSLCNPEKTIAELLRVLRPGGMALIADLYSRTEDIVLEDSPMIKNLYRSGTMESFFKNEFQLEKYADYTQELQNMFFQMLMDGKMCDCVTASDLPALKAAKVGYGVWIWKKPYKN